MSHLPKSISLWQGVGLLVTTMMGTGVFVLPQLTAQSAGSQAIYAWAILILLMIPITWVFGHLGRKFPSSGGPAHLVRLAFGDYQGQVVGLMFLLLVPVGAPAAIEITMQFLQALIPLSALPKYLVELAFLWGIYQVNKKGLSISGTIQSGLTITMLIVVIAILVSYLFPQNQPSNSVNFEPANWTLIGSTIGLAFWSFMGIETMSHLSEEFKDADRDFGKALNIGVILVGAMYLICTLFVLLNPVHQSNLAMIDVFNQQFSTGGKWAIGILGVASGAATVNVYNASTARLAYNLAEQDAAPRFWFQLNEFKIPTNALASILIMIAIVLAITNYFQISFEALILWTNGVFVLIYTLAMMSGIRLLSGKGQWMAVFATLLCFILCASLFADMLYAGVLVVVLSIWVRRKSFTLQIRA